MKKLDKKELLKWLKLEIQVDKINYKSAVRNKNYAKALMFEAYLRTEKFICHKIKGGKFDAK